VIPFNELTLRKPTTFKYPVKSGYARDFKQGWELGGIELNNSAQGLLVKVWQAILEVDKVTGIGSVYAQAVGSPKTLLFSGVDITEIDLAFDQNMNPFVAYTQSNVAKYYWYDPTALSMVHSALPGTCRTPKCCLDEHRTWNSDASDIVLAYIDGATLKVRYQRDRYAIEHSLLEGVTDNLIYVGMNTESRLQFGLGRRIYLDYT
jgi:hypothetical protein